MPKAHTERVLDRIHHVHYLVVSAGCVTTTKIEDTLGLGHSMVYYALQLLKNNKMVVEVVLGKHAIWCIDEETAKRVIEELKSEVRRLVCSNGRIRYVTPKRVLELVELDKQARKTFSRYVSLNKTKNLAYKPQALAFADSILRELFGEPQFKRGRGSVYFATC
jgi:predicted transcriptional regulator